MARSSLTPRHQRFQQRPLFGLWVSHLKDGLSDGPEQFVLAEAMFLNVGSQFLSVTSLPKAYQPIRHINDGQSAGGVRFTLQTDLLPQYRQIRVVSHDLNLARDRAAAEGVAGR